MDKLNEIFGVDVTSSEFDPSQYKVLKASEFDAMNKQRELDIKKNYEVGKTAGEEMYQKAVSTQIKEKYGIEVKPSELLNAFDLFKGKVLEEVKVEPNAKLTEKEAIIANLQTSLLDYETKYNTVVSEYEHKEFMRSVNSELVKPLKDLPLDNNDVLTLFNSSFSVERDGDKPVVKRNGEVLRHSVTQVPIGLDEAMSMFIKEKGFDKISSVQPQGRGGTHQVDGTGKMKFDQFLEYTKDKGISYNSKEYLKLQDDLLKSGKLEL